MGPLCARVRRAVLVALLLAAAACGSDGPGTTTQDRVVADGQLTGEVMVFAAASLTDVFEELATAFEREHPDLEVTLHLASSSTLATQLVEGAPADVFAAANRTQMEVVTDAGLADEPVVFAQNLLEIAVGAGNPLGIASLEDLSDDEVVLVLAAPQVPAGELAARMLAAAEVEVTPASLEVDVRATLARVELGEADAAIVYRSDLATAGGDVHAVAIPDERNLITEYPIAITADAPNPAAADAWVDLVTGPKGRAALTAAGFTVP